MKYKETLTSKYGGQLEVQVDVMVKLQVMLMGNGDQNIDQSQIRKKQK